MKRKKRSGSSDKDLKLTPNTEQETPTDIDSDSKRKFGRRGFLKLGAGAAAITLADPLDSIAQVRGNVHASTRAALQADECGDQPFHEPKPVPAYGKILTTTLTAQKLEWSYTCAGTTATGWQPVFNGALPGPTLYLDQPGSTIRITLNNHLNEMPVFGTNDNCPGGHHGDPTQPACFQHTNLHFHGLQVSPCSLIKNAQGQIVRHCGPISITAPNQLVSSSDDVLVDIYPKQSNYYEVVLPDMHAPGTNWYHSHLHGASAYQVSGGMAGGIIIREPPGPARIVRDDLDMVFLLQEILVNPPPTPTNPWPSFPPIYGTLPGGGGTPPATTFFVNGLCRPTLKARKGQLMRWRFINSGVTPGALMTLKLVKTDQCTPTVPNPIPKGEIMYLMAIDGLSFYGINPQPVRYHLMGLGSRADFLIRLDTPGHYTLYKDKYPLESVTDPDSTNFTNASGQQVLAYIDVQDSTDIPDPIPTRIPGNKPAYLNPIWKADKVRLEPIRFQNLRFNSPNPPPPVRSKFQIDGAPYDPNNPGVQVALNTAEEWTLNNEVPIVQGVDPPPQSNTHPFHVHLNPFQILGVSFDFEVSDEDLQRFNLRRMNPADPCTWPFWDTVGLPGANAPASGPPPTTQLKIRSRFLIYDGEYVTHCHILVHEDVGMMINVKLNGAGVGPSTPVHTYPPAAADCIRRTSRCPGDVPPTR